jgi:rubrerythrin
MSKEKQFEEMAKVIDEFTEPLSTKDIHKAEFSEQFAEHLYNAGYRKQSEGNWIIKKGGYYQRLVCSVCEKLSIATFDYCPNCGAKMKGGAKLW